MARASKKSSEGHSEAMACVCDPPLPVTLSHGLLVQELGVGWAPDRCERQREARSEGRDNRQQKKRPRTRSRGCEPVPRNPGQWSSLCTGNPPTLHRVATLVYIVPLTLTRHHHTRSSTSSFKGLVSHHAWRKRGSPHRGEFILFSSVLLLEVLSHKCKV